jgi:NarL family two-component system response regulator LiaR
MAHIALTQREKEILLLVMQEHTSAEIASILQLSIRTVETHRRNILEKTHCSNLLALFKYAVKSGILENFHFREPAQFSKN